MILRRLKSPPLREQLRRCLIFYSRRKRHCDIHKIHNHDESRSGPEGPGIGAIQSTSPSLPMHYPVRSLSCCIPIGMLCLFGRSVVLFPIDGILSDRFAWRAFLRFRELKIPFLLFDIEAN
jgi:hypothetical protein